MVWHSEWVWCDLCNWSLFSSCHLNQWPSSPRVWQNPWGLHVVDKKLLLILFWFIYNHFIPSHQIAQGSFQFSIQTEDYHSNAILLIAAQPMRKFLNLSLEFNFLARLRHSNQASVYYTGRCQKKIYYIVAITVVIPQCEIFEVWIFYPPNKCTI